ncbi:MAG TPA: VIT domain-containing protein, partial [Rudaea sp.]|nr:VIT domain-containing protein [Rudaea sp.]
WRTWVSFLVIIASLDVAAQTSPPVFAPYLRVAGAEDIERLPLLMTSVDATVAGVIADVGVTQTFENRGQKPIEAVYVFPGSTRAAVYAATMTIGDRTIVAKIEEKEKARAAYDAAKATGRTATLLEQRETSMFQMNVANILPGDKIKVQLRYTELLVPTEGQYEFFFPNTFTDRYVGAAQTDVATPTSSDPDVVTYSFDAHVHVAAGLPIASIDSPSHHVDIARSGANEARVALSDSESRAAQKDFVLHYRLGGDAIETGLLLAPGPDANYFALIAEPPLRVASAAIVPREFIFVVDVSGSMHGQPLALAQSLMIDLLKTLNAGDRFNIVMFSGDSKVLSPQVSIVADADAQQRADAFMHSGFGGGGTELVEALKVAYGIPATPALARTVVVITDGEIPSGGVEFRLVRDHLAEANVFAFGIGAGVNRPVIENLARGGMGEAFIVQDFEQGPVVAAKLRSYIDRPLFSHVQVRFAGFDAFDLEPKHLPDLMAERPLVLVGKYHGAPSGTIELAGLAGGKAATMVIDVPRASRVVSGDSLRYLWARSRVGRLLDEHFASPGWGDGPIADQGEDAKREITQLGLAHSLLTPYTSFVATTPDARTTDAAETVVQPAPARELAPTAPPPMPLKAAPVASGWGAPISVERKLAIDMRDRSVAGKLPRAQAEERDVAGKRFALRDGRWEDLAAGDVKTTLRVRVDSPAFARLVALSALFSEWAKLGPKVLVTFGDLAIELTPDGFSDLPAVAFARVEAAVKRTQ